MATKKKEATTALKEAPPAEKAGIDKPTKRFIGTGNIHSRLARILALIEAIPKEGRNDFHGYDYVKEDTLTQQIRPMLAAEGISLVFGAEEIVLEDNCIAHVRCTFTLGCSEGEPITTTVWGAGRDADRNHQRGDKAVYKAMTGATKYFLYKTFLVTTGDDVENDIPAADQPQQLTPGQHKELQKYKEDPKLDAEVLKWIQKMLDDGGSQVAAGRIIAEAKKQIQAFEAKQKAALDAEKKEGEDPDAPGHEPEQHPREDPMKGGEKPPMDDDDIPF